MDYKKRIEEIKLQYQTYKIDIETAKLLADPIIKQMNIDARQIADKHNQRFKKFTFKQLVLNK